MSFTTHHIQIDQMPSALQQLGTWCREEEVAGLCPDLTEDQVFLASGSLTRSSRVCLMLDINHRYWVTA